ncbi:putative acyl-coenzyme A synthetase [Cercospora beticola]|uniref:Putative acyl-coenzyme A synthetase n=1 Tax=Cercospora beticola TaxID=122368 RepID=A0A2G5HAX5_CERBT|nr:putative acyl-coenzyme A synthetase [Cercospora beticola]PIA89681.1 putative acyl-coenzyme A synthetase [Cercospora beticola]WPB02747.1 hypothetical protein RHO25_007383 [Cercospora beticola]
MPFLAEQHMSIPEKDVLSWYFDSPEFPQDDPVYIDALDTSKYWTANQCRKAIRQLAAGFRRLGLKNGDCVCIFAFNSMDYPVLANGIIGFGGVYTGCNPSYTTYELTHHLRSSRASVVIVEPELVKTCFEAAEKVGLPHERILLFADADSHGLKSWKTLFNCGEIDWPRFSDKATAQNTTAALLYSSGTTGLPKAAMLSHYNLIAQQTLFWEWKASPWKKRRLVALPMFHAATAPLCHFAPLHSGDKMFILRRFEIESFLKCIEVHQINIGAFVPPMVHMIMNSPLSKKYSMKSIRHAHAGAAPLDAGSQARFRKLLSPEAPLTQVWGMTETSCTCSCLPYEYGDETTGSVGQMLPDMDVKLCDDDGKDITAFNVRGEICVRGPLVVQGYYLNPQANARDWDEEGFFHTGDIGYRDAESKLWYIVDRKKELVKVRGFQVSPSEIEGVLLEHADIVDAAVIGVPARKASDGEEPRAYVTLREGSSLSEDAIRGLLKTQLAHYKQCVGGIVVGTEIPKSPSGKILKRLLVERAKQEMARGSRESRL